MATLTKRELEVVEKIAQGYGYVDAGRKLFISPRTIETHVKNAVMKVDPDGIGAPSVRLTRWYFKNGIRGEPNSDDGND